MTQLRTSYLVSRSKQNTVYRGLVTHVLSLKMTSLQFGLSVKTILRIWLPHVSWTNFKCMLKIAILRIIFYFVHILPDIRQLHGACWSDTKFPDFENCSSWVAVDLILKSEDRAQVFSRKAMLLFLTSENESSPQNESWLKFIFYPCQLPTSSNLIITWNTVLLKKPLAATIGPNISSRLQIPSFE
jgi:hypothetical protein